MNIVKRILERTLNAIEKQIKIGDCQHQQQAVPPQIIFMPPRETITPIGWEQFMNIVIQTGTYELRKMK